MDVLSFCDGFNNHHIGTLRCRQEGASTPSTEPSDGIIARCREWIGLHYEEPNPVQRMAETFGLNTRTFARRFRAAAGSSPIDYIQHVRIEEAKQMLKTTAGSIDDLVTQVGYVDPAAFRRTFRKLAGTTPAEYRRRFSRLIPQGHEPGET